MGTQGWDEMKAQQPNGEHTPEAGQRMGRLDFGKAVNTSVGVNSLLQVMALPSLTCYLNSQVKHPRADTTLPEHLCLKELFNYYLCGWRGSWEVYLRKAGFALFVLGCCFGFFSLPCSVDYFL